MSGIESISAIARGFLSEDAGARAAAVANALLTNIEASGRRPRFTGNDWLRLGQMLVIADVPGLIDTNRADINEAETALQRKDNWAPPVRNDVTNLAPLCRSEEEENDRGHLAFSLPKPDREPLESKAEG